MSDATTHVVVKRESNDTCERVAAEARTACRRLAERALPAPAVKLDVLPDPEPTGYHGDRVATHVL